MFLSYLEKRMRERPMVTRSFIQSQHPKNSLMPKIEQIQPLFDKGWIAQPKINGRNIQLHISNSGEIICFTRHGTIHTKQINDDLKTYLRQFYLPENESSWNVIEGEFIFQTNRIYLFDFIVLENRKLETLSWLERHKLLNRRFITPNLLVLPVINTAEAAMKVLAGDEVLVEGIVLKSPSIGFSDLNIIRCRKNGKV